MKATWLANFSVTPQGHAQLSSIHLVVLLLLRLLQI